MIIEFAKNILSKIIFPKKSTVNNYQIEKEKFSIDEEFVQFFDPIDRLTFVNVQGKFKDTYYTYLQNSNYKNVLIEFEFNLNKIWEKYIEFIRLYIRIKRFFDTINEEVVREGIIIYENQLKQPDEWLDDIRKFNIELLKKRLIVFKDIETTLKRLENQIKLIERFIELLNNFKIKFTNNNCILYKDFGFFNKQINNDSDIIQYIEILIKDLEIEIEIKE